MFVRRLSPFASLVTLSRSVASKSEAPSLQRLLEVGLVGIPNAGKSELTNHLIGQKVTAVSSKKNTTTSCQLGGYISGGNTQVILHDLPGVLRPRDVHYKGQMARIEAAWSTAKHCDVITFIVDAALVVQNVLKGPHCIVDSSMIKAMPVFELAEQMEKGRSDQGNPNVILALNKVDLVPLKERHKLPIVEEILRERCSFAECFELSALRGKGIPQLKSYFHSMAREGKWILPRGACTDKSSGELAVELVKEKLYRRLNKELPYRLEAELVKDGICEAGGLLFEIQVRVPNEHVKKIVVGKRGSIIEDYVTTRARKELESALRKRVSLNVNVKVRG